MPEIANGSVFSQTDGSNTGALPGLTGSSSPALIDNSIQALMGAIKREHDWRNFTITSSGSANAYVLTYAVAPAAYYTGQAFGFKTNFAVTGAATVNVNTLGAKTIKKLVSGTKTDLASGDIASGDYVSIVYDGTDFVWTNKGVASVSAATDTAAGIVELATTTETITGTDATRAVTPDSLAALWEQGSDVASAGTISLGEGGYFNITGTTTITDIDFATDKAGRPAWVKFAGALTLTHNASTLILPGGANITTAAGDTACFVSEGSDVVRCTVYQKASGLPVVSPTSGAVYVGNGVATSAAALSITGISQYTSLLFQFTMWNSGAAARTASVAVSSNGGSSYGTARQFTSSLAVGASETGSVTISNTKNNGANKVVTPANGKSDGSTYTTTATETVVTGIIDAIQFTISGTNCAASITVWGIP